MTKTDSRGWRELYGKLCAIYDRVFDEAQSRFYFDALKEFDLRDLEAAALDLAQTLKWFPKPAEWRTAVFARRFRLRRDRDQQLVRQGLTRKIHCAFCQDTGWKPSATDETRVRRCPCRETNPNYLRLQALERLAGEGETPSRDEAKQLTDRVCDWKQLRSGDE